MKLEQLLTHKDPQLRKLVKAIHSSSDNQDIKVEHASTGQDNNGYPYVKLALFQKGFYIQFQYFMGYEKFITEYIYGFKWFIEILPSEIKPGNKVIRKNSRCFDRILECYKEVVHPQEK